MFRRKYCISNCAISAIAIVILLFGQMNPSAAQTASTLPNPDRIASNYPIRYGSATIESITEILNRIRTYLDGCTPVSIVNSKTREPVIDFSKLPAEAALERGAIPIVSSG
jgi:hypothetical protein